MALARAIVNRPALLLLDEPLGALDLKLRRQMQLELKTIQEEVGLTFLHVTHDQEEAMTMADTVAVMNKGSIEQMGAPEELYELPRTAFVANFLGQSNLFTGEVVTTNTSIPVDVAGTAITVPPAAHSATGRVTVGVRPREGRAPPRGAAGDVRPQRPRTGARHRRVVLGRQHRVHRRRPGRRHDDRVRAEHGLRPGRGRGLGVWISWDVEHGFGLADEPDESSRFPADDDTRTIAVQRREALISELEGD